MRYTIIIAILISTLTIATHAEEEGRAWKSQVFAGQGIVSSDGKSVTATVRMAGYATLFPVGDHGKYFVRPFAVLGEVNPEDPGKDAFPIGQVGTLIVRKMNSRLALAGGGAVTVIASPSGTELLPTAIVTSGVKLRGGISLFTPISYNRKGWGVALQVGYTW